MKQIPENKEFMAVDGLKNVDQQNPSLRCKLAFPVVFKEPCNLQQLPG
jgi:hypothetical protein